MVAGFLAALAALISLTLSASTAPRSPGEGPLAPAGDDAVQSSGTVEAELDPQGSDVQGPDAQEQAEATDPRESIADMAGEVRDRVRERIESRVPDAQAMRGAFQSAGEPKSPAAEPGAAADVDVDVSDVDSDDCTHEEQLSTGRSRTDIKCELDSRNGEASSRITSSSQNVDVQETRSPDVR